MPFFPWNRLWSKQAPPPESPLPPPSDSPSALVESERPASSNNHRRYSRDSEGYPSWLPQRPPPPAPRSTFQSSNINLRLESPTPELPSPTTPVMVGGRKPTPRSVRIVSLHDDYAEKVREPTDQTRVPSGPMHARAWSRATAPTLFSDPAHGGPRAPRPRFRAKGLHLELLETPGWGMKTFFYLFRIFVFLHIPVQTYLDFNVAYMLSQVARFPTPESSTVPGSGRNWALATAAYAACWLIWIVGLFLMYEVIYSFSRRWRVKCPLIYPIYFSSPAFNLAAITSYTNFCFLYHVRFSSLKGTDGATDSTSDIPNAGSLTSTRPRSIRTFLSETFSFYSQNLPTVALLIPRAGLSLALLLAFTSPDPVLVALANQNLRLGRDDTFFQANGTLTAYATGVLWANIAWTGWRLVVLFISWIGLLFVSGQPCAGLCGPRYRWEEEDVEKRKSTYSAYSTDHPDDISEQYREHDALQWNWRDDTRERIIEAWEFCLTSKHPRWSSGFTGLPKLGKGVTDQSHLLTPGTETYPFENMQQILAAVGLGGAPPASAARRGVLSDDFFRGPHSHSRRPSEQIEIVERTETPPELKTVDAQRVPQVVRKRESKGKKPERYPYPFTADGAHMSSEDQIAVPFPPSPLPSDEGHEKASGSTSGSPEGEDALDEDADVEEDEEGDGEDEVASGEPRTSGSMSSLGNPVSSRYPFQFRVPGRPQRGTNTSHSSGAYSHSHSNSYSVNRSVHSRVSAATQSTGNVESSESHSPRSRYTTSSGSMAGTSSSGPASPTGAVSSGIPMPPRHPRARARAGTVPLPSGQSSPSPDTIAFPRGNNDRVRAESNITQAFGVPLPSRHEVAPDVSLEMTGMEDLEPEPQNQEEAVEHDAEDEDGEEEDEVGLLSNASSRGPSPRSSFIGVRHRGSSSSFTALRHRASNSFSQSMSQLQHAARVRHRSHESASGSASGSRSSSNSRSNHSAGSSISVAVRSRAQSLIHGAAGSRSHSSLENTNMVIEGPRSRANSSMARLEEDAPASADVSYSSNSDARTQTHSRSGSTSGTGSASAEGYTFGRPLPAAQVRPQIEAPVEEVTEGSPTSPRSPETPSIAASATPSQVFSERTVTPLGPSNISSSPPQPSFISSAPTSLITDPPAAEGATTDDSIGHRAGELWAAENRDLDLHERTGGTYRPT